MKFTTIIAFVFFTFMLYSSGYTQDTLRKPLGNKNEIGLDVTQFVKQILNFNGSESNSSNLYLLSYKRLLLKKNAIRFGIGGYSETVKDTGGFNSMKNYSDQSTYLDMRLGFERQNRIGTRFLFYYGLDMLYGYKYSISHNMSTPAGTPDIKAKTNQLGGGAVIGICYTIYSRISISTESSVSYLFSKKETNIIYPNAVANNSMALREESTTRINSPLFINLLIKF